MDYKTDRPGFFKTDSGAVINKDNDALMAYKKTKARAARLDKLEEDVKEMKSYLELILAELRK